jgi:hypothetical protein
MEAEVSTVRDVEDVIGEEQRAPLVVQDWIEPLPHR